MKIGITGTRSGMSDHQKQVVARFLQNSWIEGAEFHHGDCVGVDVEAAEIAKSLGYTVIAHPGPGGELCAGHESDEVRPNYSHFKRNRNIVDETDFLIVVPMQNEWQSKGGTWYTHDYAFKHGKALVIFYPEPVDVP